MELEDRANVLLIVKLVVFENFMDIILRRMCAYCLFHLASFINVVLVEDQNQSATPVKPVTRKKAFFVPKHGEYVREACANKLKTVAESGVAMEFLKDKNKTVNSLGRAGGWLETIMRRLFLRNCHTSV